jgi:hypothetical protein
MSDFNYDEWIQNVAATKSDEQRRSLSPDELDRYLRYFNDARGYFAVVSDQMPTGKKETCEERIELLRAEKGLRRVESSSKSQHDETMELGQETLNWTKVAAWGAIAAVIVASIPLVVQNCSRTSSTQTDTRPTPTETPQQSATGTPSQ